MSMEGLSTFALNEMGSHYLKKGPCNLLFNFQKRPAREVGGYLFKMLILTRSGE